MSILQNYPPNTSKFPLSLGIERQLLTALSTFESDISEAEFASAVTDAYRLAYPDKEVKENLPDILKSVLDYFESAKQQPATKPHKHFGQSLGSQYAEWLSKLDATGACLLLADYDLEKAKQWYWFESVDLVREALQIKSQHLSQQVLASMESALYGFGGKYNSDESGGNVVDLNSGEGAELLKSLGF